MNRRTFTTTLSLAAFVPALCFAKKRHLRVIIPNNCTVDALSDHLKQISDAGEIVDCPEILLADGSRISKGDDLLARQVVQYNLGARNAGPFYFTENGPLRPTVSRFGYDLFIAACLFTIHKTLGPRPSDRTVKEMIAYLPAEPTHPKLRQMADNLRGVERSLRRI